MERERLFRYIIAAIAFSQLLLSAYMLRAHYAPEGESFCNINETFNCDVVNNSIYAEIFGIPVALLGILNYLMILIFTLWPDWVLRLASLSKRTGYLLFTLYMFFGFLFSLYLTAIEAFILKAYCPLCLASAAAVTIILVMAGILWTRTPLKA